MVNAVGGQPVVLAQKGQEGGQPGAGQAAEVFLLGVLVVAPDVARRRQAVADVHRLRPGDDAVAEAALVAQHHVVAAQVELLEGERVEREVELLLAVGEGQAVDERRADVPLAPVGGHARAVVERRVQRRVGVEADQRLQHVLRAAELVEPVVDEGEVHEGGL
jgi:hypothetical protein